MKDMHLHIRLKDGTTQTYHEVTNLVCTRGEIAFVSKKHGYVIKCDLMVRFELYQLTR